MFEPESRYAPIPDAVWTAPDGSTRCVYKRRRFLPEGSRMPLIGRIAVEEGERLDLVTARTLGSPELFWRIADANNAMDPLALTARPGRRLRVPEPQIEAPVRELQG